MTRSLAQNELTFRKMIFTGQGIRNLKEVKIVFLHLYDIFREVGHVKIQF